MSDRFSAAGSDARAQFAEARNCAESVLASLSLHEDVPSLPEFVGSGFTSGIGNTGCLCGSLAGSVMVIGAYADSLGLMPEARKLIAEELSAEMTRRFKDEYHATCCRVIKRDYVEGSNESLSHCAGITEFAATTVAEIIDEHRSTTDPVKRFGVRDVMAASESIARNLLMGIAVGLAAGAVLGFWLAPSLAWAVGGIAYGLLVGLLSVFGDGRMRMVARVAALDGLLASAVLVAIMLFAEHGGPAAALLTALSNGGWAAATILAVGALSVVVLTAAKAFKLVRYR